VEVRDFVKTESQPGLDLRCQSPEPRPQNDPKSRLAAPLPPDRLGRRPNLLEVVLHWNSHRPKHSKIDGHFSTKAVGAQRYAVAGELWLPNEPQAASPKN
jgi:hypothetical protein